MILSDVFERFIPGFALVRHGSGGHGERHEPPDPRPTLRGGGSSQFTNKLLFSTSSISWASWSAASGPRSMPPSRHAPRPSGRSIDAVYDKLDGIEIDVSAALVQTVAARLAPVIDAMEGARPDWLPGYRTRILDGNHLPGSEHRLKELRTIRAAALPGHALVVLDPRLMLATDVVLCEDGHAQERSLLDQILAMVAAKDLWVADRNFCTTDFLFGIVRGGGSFADPTTCRDAALGVRRQAAGLRPDRDGPGLRADDPGPPTKPARS